MTMKSKIEFEECFRDSPKFRTFLDEQEASCEHLEQKLERAIKMCTIAVDSGKEYVKNQSAFATSLWDLQGHFQDNKPAHNALGKMIHCLQEMNKFHTILLDQASRTVLKNLTSYVKSDIKEVKDYKHLFVKVSESLDVALIRNAQANKNKYAEVTEAVNILSATTSCFRHTALDYVNLLIMLQAKKIPEILSTLLSYYQACNTFYHQGFDLCNDFELFFKGLGDDIGEMRSDANQLEKTMQNRHTSVSTFIDDQLTTSAYNTSIYNNSNHDNTSLSSVSSSSTTTTTTTSKSTSIKVEGYLFKRTSKGFKSWNRRWFYLCNNQLVYKKRGEPDPPTIMEEDLRICTVRPINDSDRRFCFEVISPTKSHTLQADSFELLNMWITALHKNIGAAIQDHKTIPSALTHTNIGGNNNDGGSTSSLPGSGNYKKINWEQFLKIPGNSNCCDCGHPEPRWASINLGITLCIACSGVHRSLGVHHSKVRSLTLDAWEPEIVKVMMELGNQTINKIYEAKVLDAIPRATENCTQMIREKWIKTKYVEKRFVQSIVNVILADKEQKKQQRKRKKQLKNNNTNNTIHQTTKESTSKTTTKSNEHDSDKDIDEQQQQDDDIEEDDENIRENGAYGNNNIAENLITQRRWSVRKLRRRSKSQSGKKLSVSNRSIVTHTDEDKDADDSESVKSEKSNQSVLLIGNELSGDVLMQEDFQLSSDQESTGGEDNSLDIEDITKLDANMLLYKASAVHNLPVMCQALALGANKNFINEDDLDRTSLHQAVLSGSVMACEYLLLNGAHIDATDRNGYTPLHLATERGSTAQAYLLLKHRAKHDITAKDGQKPIDIAVHLTNADIVTLLRLTRLNEEIGLCDSGPGEGDTYNDVMKDFSRFAVTQPHKLQRNTKYNDTTSTTSTASTND